MMKKIKLAKATAEQVYSDAFGWVASKINFKVKAEFSNGKRNNSNNPIDLSANRVYIKDGVSFRNLTNAEVLHIHEIHLYSVDYNPYYYNDAHINENNAIEILNPEITVNWNGITSIEELADVVVYEGDSKYHTLMDYEILPEMLVQVDESEGTYMVTECFEQPNRENKLCIVEPLVTFEGDTRQAVVINTESKQLYTVPYAEYAAMPNELDVFNHPLRETELQPTLMHHESGSHLSQIKKANLFWQPIEEASAYTVSLYYYNSSERLKNKLYLLQRFEVERNVHWLTIENLMGNCKFIVMLEAEDRQGNIIARTRGIDVASGKPQWW